MKTVFLVAAIVALVAAAAWALSGSKPAGSAYMVEVRDVAGVRGLVASSEVVAGSPEMSEVVSEARGQKFGKPSREEV